MPFGMAVLAVAESGNDVIMGLREGTCDKTSFRGRVCCQFCRR